MKVRHIKMNKKILTSLAVSTLLVSGAFALSTSGKKVDKPVEAIDKPSTIYLDDTEEQEIRNYYSYLETLADSERRGMNLLKNLKYILVNNPSNPSKPAQYFTYSQVREIYRITDRNWVASPKENISGYNSKTNTITNFDYSEDPYGYFYYRDDNFTNPHRLNDKVTSKEGTQQTLLNQEHIWSKSHGFSESGGVVNAGTDLHHLVAADVAGNKWGHSNYAYGYVGTEASDWIKTKNNWDNGANAILNNKRGSPLNPSSQDTSNVIFEPRDEDKGDFARALLYMMARYNYIGHENETPSIKEPNLKLVDYIADDEFNTTAKGDVALYGKLSDILEFHRNDPVKVNDQYDFEVHRNNLIYENFQYTRNPFIDFPQWVELVWGDQAETGVASPSTDPLYSYEQSGESIAVSGVSLDVNQVEITAHSSQKVTATVSPSDATNKRIDWTSSDESVATVSSKGIITGISEGDAVITATTEDGGFTATVSVHVNPYYEGEMVTDDFYYNSFTSTGYYSDFTDVQDKTGTLYTGSTSVKTNTVQIEYEKSIQMNGDGGHYIYNTNSIGSVRKIEVDFSTDTVVNRPFHLYGSSTPIISPTGAELISTITFSKEVDEDNNYITKYTADIVGNYPYILISSVGAIYMNKLSITWEKPIEVTGVYLDKNSLNLDVDDTYQLVATVLPEYALNKEVTWSSSNTSVATVNDGLVTAKTSGSATITVTTVIGNHEASCVVNVSKSESGSGKLEFVFGEQGYTNGTAMESAINLYTDSENSNQKIDLSFGKGTRTYYPTYYTENSAVRIYGSQTITVSSSLSNLVSIDFVLATKSATASNTITASVGTYTDNGPTTATEGRWTCGSSMTNSVTLTVGGTSGQRRVVSMTITYYDSFAFAKEFLNETVCDSSGVTPPAVNWTSLLNKAAVLFDSDKTYLKTVEASETGNKVEQAVARYDYIVGKYGTSSYSDFLLREPVPINRSGITYIEENDNSMFIIVLVAISSLSTMVLLIIKKKKRSNK